MITSKLKARQEAIAEKQQKELAALGATKRRIAKARLRILIDALDGVTDAEAASMGESLFDKIEDLTTAALTDLGFTWAESLKVAQTSQEEEDESYDSESDPIPAE